MQDPLKQGLKPGFLYESRIILAIRMQDPLKQGLKRIIYSGCDCAQFGFECKIH